MERAPTTQFSNPAVGNLAGPWFTPGLRPIDEIRLAAPAASVTFSSIPQYYRTLKLICDARSARVAEADNLVLRFNGDAGNNYDFVRLIVQCGGAATPGCLRATSGIQIGWIEAANSTAGTFGPMEITLVGYALTDRYKRGFCASSGVFGNLSVNTDLYIAHHRGQRRNIAATTSVTAFALNGNLVAGSTFTLYGVL